MISANDRPRGGKAPRPAVANRASRRPSPYAAGPAITKPAPRNAYSFRGEKGRCVYVGNLAYSVSWQDLKDHFKPAGEVVHADVMAEVGTGRSKGCGLVVFANAKDASSAIRSLHDSELHGRKIFVREDREEGQGGGGGEGQASVYVGNLSWEVTWQDLKDHFKPAGEVVHADVMAEAGTGRSKGCGLVVFANAAAAAHAISTLHDSELHGRQIFCREDREAGVTRSAVIGGASAVRPVVPGGPFAARPVPSFGAPAIGAVPGTKVRVANLPFETTWQELKDIFREVGAVSRADVATGPDKRSKGFGHVTFGSAREAAKAIQLFNGADLGGRKIEVLPDA